MNQQHRQGLFVSNVAKLIERAAYLGIGLSFGESYRSSSQQLLYYYGYQVVEGEAGLVLTKANQRSS